jgi:hypothetical protein
MEPNGVPGPYNGLGAPNTPFFSPGPANPYRTLGHGVFQFYLGQAGEKMQNITEDVRIIFGNLFVKYFLGHGKLPGYHAIGLRITRFAMAMQLPGSLPLPN